jgi:coenzyme F420-0:L-glutamate ligase/coenzyme F420-1:gamma-L-glutamate ligase
LVAALGCPVGLIINDSWGRPWRMGTTGAALGVAGLSALHDYRGRDDLFGRELIVSVEAVADELAGAANILMGQADEGAPVVIVRGFASMDEGGSARDLLRPREGDLFR